MDTLLELMFVFAVIAGMAFVVAQMSRDREIGFWTLFAVSVFFTPFIGVLVGLMAKRKRTSSQSVPLNEAEAKEAQAGFWERFTPSKDK